MKAKRIAELKNAMAIARMNHDWLTASLICAELSAVITTGSKPCSDQLRAELTANNIEMNRLTERNDVILSTLRGRGLEPVRVRDDVKCKVMSFKGYGRVPKLLTCEDLKLGGWFCRDVGNRSAVAFVEHGFDVCLFHEWGRSHESYAGCVLNLEDRKVTRVYTINDSCFEIVRFGNQFYRV